MTRPIMPSRSSEYAAAPAPGDVITLPFRQPTAIQFTAHGTPIGQGRISSFGTGRPAVHSNAKTLKPWRRTVAAAALEAMGGAEPWGDYQPITITACFTLHRPKKPRNDLPTTRGLDIDHAVRAVLDAITGVVYTDDAQVVELRAVKVYVGDPLALPTPGVVIHARKVTP